MLGDSNRWPMFSGHLTTACCQPFDLRHRGPVRAYSIRVLRLATVLAREAVHGGSCLGSLHLRSHSWCCPLLAA
jgi:hypothetical protein